MTIIDYSREPRSDIAFVDMKSFYASVECVQRGLHPLNTSLCVMSNFDNYNGLILASSPVFKEVFGRSNVGRARDLPFDINTRKFSFENASRQNINVTKKYIEFVEQWAEKTFIVPPRMALYIQENIKIQKIFQNFASPSEICPYSIDEAFIDLTTSINYFVGDSTVSRKDKLDIVCSRIQNDIWREIGIYSAIGMSNANPLLAKLALDNEAKKTKSMRANWSYEDIETKVWGIDNLVDFWGIGSRTAKRLNKIGIYSIKELANFNPEYLKKEFGVMGVQLWFHANGVDESKVTVPYKPQSKGLGNSQVLPRNYTKQSEIEIVLKEIAEQVAIRLRRIDKDACVVSIYIGFSHNDNHKSINASKKIKPTHHTEDLIKHVIDLFRCKFNGGSVRRIGVRYEQLQKREYQVFSLFDDPIEMQKKENLENAIDGIRDKFGYLAIQKGTSLMEGSRVRQRSKLIGGHCGGMDGTK